MEAEPDEDVESIFPEERYIQIWFAKIVCFLRAYLNRLAAEIQGPDQLARNVI